jgi:hypothetical protein
MQLLSIAKSLRETNFDATDFIEVKFNFEEYVAKIRHMGLNQASRLSLAYQL